jgi:regulatory LuxR family protein
LGISERTVKLHRHEVTQKLKVRSLAELAVIGERLGLLPDRNGKMADGSAQIDDRRE